MAGTRRKRHKLEGKKASDGLSQRRFKEDFKTVCEKQGWKSQFDEDQIACLKRLLGDLYSKELILDIERIAQHYFSCAYEGFIRTPSAERKRAEGMRKTSEELSKLLSPVTEDAPFLYPRVNPIENLRKRLGDRRFDAFVHDLKMVSMLCSDYCELNHREKLQPINYRDSWKLHFVYDLAISLHLAGFPITKSKDTKFYRLVVVAFELLGKDAVANPIDYVVAAYEWVEWYRNSRVA